MEMSVFYLQSFRRGSRVSHTCDPRVVAVSQQNGTATSMFYTANQLNWTGFWGVKTWWLFMCLINPPLCMVKPSVYKVRPWKVSCVSLINSTPCTIHFHFLPSIFKSSLFPSDFLANMLNV